MRFCVTETGCAECGREVQASGPECVWRSIRQELSEGVIDFTFIVIRALVAGGAIWINRDTVMMK